MFRLAFIFASCLILWRRNQITVYKTSHNTMPLKQILFVSFLFVTLFSSAQQQPARNIVKVNVPSLLVKNVSVQYELILSRKVSAAVGFRYMPTTGLPFKNAIADAVDGDEDVRSVITKTEIGNFAATPEIRFYLGKGYGRGFYLAPYYRYVRFNTGYFPVNYTSSVNGTKQTLTITGDMSANNGGLLLGAQWPLGKHFTLDWWIVGAHFGSGNGNLDGRTSAPLSSTEQAQIKSNLEEIDIPLVNKTVSVSANQVAVAFNGAFGGLRSGLCFGFRF